MNAVWELLSVSTILRYNEAMKQMTKQWIREMVITGLVKLVSVLDTPTTD